MMEKSDIAKLDKAVKMLIGFWVDERARGEKSDNFTVNINEFFYGNYNVVIDKCSVSLSPIEDTQLKDPKWVDYELNYQVLDCDSIPVICQKMLTGRTIICKLKH